MIPNKNETGFIAHFYIKLVVNNLCIIKPNTIVRAPKEIKTQPKL